MPILPPNVVSNSHKPGIFSNLIQMLDTFKPDTAHKNPTSVESRHVLEMLKSLNNNPNLILEYNGALKSYPHALADKGMYDHLSVLVHSAGFDPNIIEPTTQQSIFSKLTQQYYDSTKSGQDREAIGSIMRTLLSQGAEPTKEDLEIARTAQKKIPDDRMLGHMQKAVPQETKEKASSPSLLKRLFGDKPSTSLTEASAHAHLPPSPHL